MNRFMLRILTAILCIMNTFSFPVSADAPDIKATGAILIDTQNSMVMYEKNSTARIQPAGFTKIVTALVVLENCNNLNEVISASPETIAECDFSFGNMGILANEELSVDALLNGMLLYDAAEAAEVLAGYTFGNYNKFISAMNELAKKAGALDTVFTNAGGYYDEQQYSTVADISKIALYAMKNSAFSQIVKKDMAVIEPTNKYHETRYLSNTNMFVGRNRSLDFYSQRVSGVKTSYMKDFGYGICITFENSKGNFLCVVSGAGNATEAHTEAQVLRQYAADGFTSVKIAKKDDIIEEVVVPNGKTDHVLLKTADDLYVCLPIGYDESKIYKISTKDNNISAPIEKDQVLGTLSVSYDGNEVGSTDLIAYSAVERSAGKSVRLFFISIFTSPLFYLPALAVLGAFAVMIYKANISKLRKLKTKGK